jgi:heme-degrading monooxygenase HmoA
VWDFKKGLSEAEKASLFYTMRVDLENLVGAIPGIIELRVMRDIVNAGINGEGQIVLDATFESQAAFEVYRFHPAHLEIAAYVVSDIVENRRGVNFMESETTGHTKKFRHIVIWEFQDGLNEEDKDRLFNKMKEDLEALVGIIDGLIELSVIRDHYNLDGNGQVALIALFDSRADWENYVPHPEHQRIATYVVRDIVIVGTRRGGNFYELD